VAERAILICTSKIFPSIDSGFGMESLDDIDPNPENFVGAGIIKTKTAQVGCLLRLEPNKQAKVTCVSCECASEKHCCTS